MRQSESTNRDQPLSRQLLATRNYESPTAIKLWWIVLIAVTAATITNVIFYFILTRWLEEPLLMIAQFPPPEMVPMSVGEVILFSTIWALGAGLVYVFLNAMTARPDQKFMIISAVILLASLVLPLKLPTPPVAMSAKLSLAAMHLTGAIMVVGLLIGLNAIRSR